MLLFTDETLYGVDGLMIYAMLQTAHTPYVLRDASYQEASVERLSREEQLIRDQKKSWVPQ